MTNAAPRPLTPMDEVLANLARLAPEFEKVLPGSLPVEKFIRVTQTYLRGEPKILECQRDSVYRAIMDAARTGLLLDKREAAIVPRGGQAQFTAMIQGIYKLIRNSGEIGSIAANDVFDGDIFEQWTDDTGEHVNHRPVGLGKPRGVWIGTYAVARTKDGHTYVEVMDAEQMQAIQKMSRGKDSPWSGPFAGEMRRKSVVRRLSKRLPLSTDIEATLAADDVFQEPEPKPEQDAAPAAPAAQAPKNTSQGLRAAMGVSPQATPPPPGPEDQPVYPEHDDSDIPI